MKTRCSGQRPRKLPLQERRERIVKVQGLDPHTGILSVIQMENEFERTAIEFPKGKCRHRLKKAARMRLIEEDENKGSSTEGELGAEMRSKCNSKNPSIKKGHERCPSCTKMKKSRKATSSASCRRHQQQRANIPPPRFQPLSSNFDSYSFLLELATGP